MRKSHLAPEIASMVEEPLSPEEFDRRLSVPLSEEEAAEMEELIAWFARRYPTPKERLAFARRKYAEWTRTATFVKRDG
jgi:hypothetical protein